MFHSGKCTILPLALFVVALCHLCAEQPNNQKGTALAPSPPPGTLTIRTGAAYRGEPWTWIFLTWDKIPGASAYDVYRGTKPGEYSERPVASGVKATNYRDDGQEGVTYYYRITPAGRGIAGYSNEANATPKNPLFRDTRAYPPLRVKWTIDPRLKQVTCVFPHPVLLQRAVLATDTGLLITEDAGRNWSKLPEASLEKTGSVRDIVFHPMAIDTFYVASQTRGILITNDNGKTFTQLAAKSTGLPSDTVVSLAVYSGDPTHRTLLAVHGETAPGLSRSRDGGKTWDIVNKEYCFRRVICSDRPSSHFLLIGSIPKEPDIQKLFSCNTAGEFVTEVMPDILPTGLAHSPVPQNTFYLSTTDNGLYRIDTTEFLPASIPLPFNGASGWASVNVTWGASADMINLFLYDPSKQGMVVSHDNLVTSYTASNGLPTGPFIKEGAAICPNANGTVFYTPVNGSLAMGRVQVDVPAVTLKPAAFELPDRNEMENDWKKVGGQFDKFSNAAGNTVDAAKALVLEAGDPGEMYHRCQLTVTARLPAGAAAPATVTADLSRFGGSHDTPLFDDGKHSDGTAGDGLYGMRFALLPSLRRPPQYEWRVSFPGRIPLGVTATYPDGRHEGAVGVLAVGTHIHDIDMWYSDGWPFAVHAEGQVSTQVMKPPAGTHKASRALQVDIRKGNWAIHIKTPYWFHDITSHPAMEIAMWLDTGEPPKEINVQFCDRPEFSEPTMTGSTEMLPGAVPGSDNRRVVVPIARLVEESPQFQTTHLDEIILSGSAEAPATLVIDGLRFLATDAENTPSSSPAK